MESNREGRQEPGRGSPSPPGWEELHFLCIEPEEMINTVEKRGILCLIIVDFSMYLIHHETELSQLTGNKTEW